MSLESTIEFVPAPQWTGRAINRAMKHKSMPKPPATVLDLGSGDGRVVMAFAQKGYNAYGIEINEQLVNKSWEKTSFVTLSGTASFTHGNYLPQEMRTRLKPEPHVLLQDTPDPYKQIGKTPQDFDMFFIYPHGGQMDSIFDFFKTYARKSAVLMALGDEIDWQYNGDPQIAHMGTINLPEGRYTLYRKD